MLYKTSLQKPHPRRFKTGITVLLMAMSGIVFAIEKPQLVFEQISVAQGLSQSIVGQILQDTRGYLWFGTEDGLNIYDGYGFTVLRTEPTDPYSLSYNQVTALFEDRSGIIWVGTFNGGLNRYILKKNRFMRYRHTVWDITSLSNDYIYCIDQDRRGNLWVGTDNGLNQISPQDHLDLPVVFVRYLHNPADSTSISDKHVRAIAVDSTGNIWFGTDQGLNLLTPEQAGKDHSAFVHFRHDPQDCHTLSHDTVRTLYVDRAGTLWIGTVNGLNRLVMVENKPAFFQRYIHDPRDPYSLSNNHIYAILEDEEGYMWLGTDGGGLNRFDPKTEKFISYRNDPQNPNSLSRNEIRSLYQDHSGLLWVGTYGGGVNKVNTQRKDFKHYTTNPDDPNSLNQAIVWGIYQDQDSVLWIGTHGGGLNKFDRRRNLYTHYKADRDDPFSLSHDIIRVVIPDYEGKLWIGTHGGGICRFDPVYEKFTRYLHQSQNPNSLAHNEIRSLFLDTDSVLWIGTQGGGLDLLDTRNLEITGARFQHYRHDPADSNSICSDYIRYVYKDHSGIYWIGTQGGGLDRWDRSSGEITHFRHDPEDPYSISSNYIFSIYEDSKARLWLATWGGGLNKYDRKTGKFTYYSTKDGLPNDAIYGILEDRGGNLWFASNNGLTRFDPQTENCKNYNIRDGLQSNEFNGGSYFQSKSGEMFFGGINGFNSFFPDQIKNNQYIPPIVIVNFRKMNKEVRFDRPVSEVTHLRLSHRDYIFSFEFAALDYTAPEKNLYAYKMDGLDQEWIYTTADNRLAQFTTLPSGVYTFRVKGSNNDGIWNETGVALSITITPPFWQTWAFRTAVFLLVGALGVLFYLRRLRVIRMRAELHAAHDMQMAIMPQKNPDVPGFDISGICIPANEVGGDFFDYTWMGCKDGSFGIIIGDVSGKAMRAAFTAVMANGIVYAEARDGTSVAEILTRTNRLLYPKMDRRTFTALCFVALDPASKSMQFTNAGLVEPVLKSGLHIKRLPSSGSPYPLGLINEHTYQDETIQLHSGDILILQSDGLQDAMNNAQEFYGEERLMQFLEKIDTKALSATEIRDAIIQDVQNFIGQVRHYDDMTVIVVKVQ